MNKKIVIISSKHHPVTVLDDEDCHKTPPSYEDTLAAKNKRWNDIEAFRKKLLKKKGARRNTLTGSISEYYEKQNKMCEELLANIKRDLPELKKLMERASSHWDYEDLVYRFYHQSHKVYHIQGETLKILYALGQAAPKDTRWNDDFLQIFKEGTGKVFKSSHNADWLKHTRPMLEAFFHAKYFLEMAVKYGEELKEVPQTLPSGYAGLLYLYGLR